MSSHDFQPILQSFLQDPALPFADVLSEETIRRVAREAGVPIDLPPADEKQTGFMYTTPVTLWAFLSQMLHQGPNRSCVAAVARIALLCIALNRAQPSPDTGAYCRARDRLPLLLIQRLTEHVADETERNVPKNWLWKNRRVLLPDGTTVSTSDTPELQQAYPQPKSQRPGLGFPLIRMVAIMSLATGMVHGMAMGPNVGKKTGETALLRQLFDRLQAGDVLLCDCCYCSYFMIALLRQLGVDCAMRIHQRRKYDFHRGRIIGPDDHVVSWSRPARPDWMDRATYETMPATIEIRELRVTVDPPGFRVESFVVATTLTDEHEYPKVDIAELYHRRWLVELDLGSLKIGMRMDVLRCKSPDMVQKEIGVCLLAYNLIRLRIVQAALAAKLSPRQLSFTAALQQTAASWTTALYMSDAQRLAWIEASLRTMASHRIGDRPGRVEPRAVKRRAKPHPLLNRPRAEARAKLTDKVE